jgi:hypothetical protein
MLRISIMLKNSIDIYIYQATNDLMGDGVGQMT